MSIYVDDARLPYGRMRMSHMLADSHAELVSMADRIGVNRRWIQYASTWREHFDVCESKRNLVLKHGAQAVTVEWVADFRAARRRVI